MNLGWGGQALVQKRGQVSDGGIDKISPDGGDPPVPPAKNPGACSPAQTSYILLVTLLICSIDFLLQLR